MASPVSSALGTPGNLIASGTSVAAGKTAGAQLDASAIFEAQINGKAISPGTLGSTPLPSVAAYQYYAETTLSAAVAQGATSLTVASAAGIVVGQSIALVNTAPSPGEIVTVTAISGTTLTVAATQFAYASAATVLLIEQTPSTSVQLASPTGAAYAVSTPYSKNVDIDTGRYFVVVANGDTAAWTCEMSLNTWTGVA